MDSIPGEGSCFTAYYPVTIPPQLALYPASDYERDQGHPPFYILLVEEDSLSAVSTEHLFESMGGVYVQVAQTAEQALVYLSLQSFNLVITNIDLLGMSGTEFVKALLNSAQSTPVVILSDYSRDSVVASELLGLGVEAFYQKPMNPLDAAALVKRLTPTPPVHGLSSDESTQEAKTA